MILDEADLAKVDDFTRAFESMPVRYQVAWWRPGILSRCLRWRKQIKDGTAPLDMLKWEQSRLAEMRAWRANGVRLSVH